MALPELDEALLEFLAILIGVEQPACLLPQPGDTDLRWPVMLSPTTSLAWLAASLLALTATQAATQRSAAAGSSQLGSRTDQADYRQRELFKARIRLKSEVAACQALLDAVSPQVRERVGAEGAWAARPVAVTEGELPAGDLMDAFETLFGGRWYRVERSWVLARLAPCGAAGRAKAGQPGPHHLLPPPGHSQPASRH